LKKIHFHISLWRGKLFLQLE